MNYSLEIDLKRSTPLDASEKCIFCQKEWEEKLASWTLRNAVSKHDFSAPLERLSSVGEASLSLGLSQLGEKLLDFDPRECGRTSGEEERVRRREDGNIPRVRRV